MANTTADKLALLEATKANLKAALAEKGQTVGDVFSTYPAAVRAIETTSLPQMVTVKFSLPHNNTSAGTTVYYCTILDASVVFTGKTYPRNDTGVQELDVLTTSYLVFDKAASYITDQTNMTRIDSWGSGTSGGSLFLA